MSKVKILITISIVLILSSTMFAQVEKTVKENKSKIEKIDKKAADSKEMAKEVMSGKKCGPECKMACCTTEAKEIKAEMKSHNADCKCEACTAKAVSMKKGEKMMKKAHSKDCDCEGCKTASAANNVEHKMLKKAHAADCDCEGCKVAHMEMKKQKAHGEDCSCEGCKKS